MTLADYKEKVLFDYQWSKMTDEEKDNYIKDRDAELADQKMAIDMMTWFEADLFTPEDIQDLLITTKYGPETKKVIARYALEKELIGQGEAMCYFDL